MIVTEQEATKKLCHKTMGRAPAPEAPAGPYPCVGSRCMAWQWFDDEGRADRRGKCGLINHSFEPGS